jgi:hypothetical protein
VVQASRLHLSRQAGRLHHKELASRVPPLAGRAATCDNRKVDAGILGWLLPLFTGRLPTENPKLPFPLLPS